MLSYGQSEAHGSIRALPGIDLVPIGTLRASGLKQLERLKAALKTWQDQYGKVVYQGCPGERLNQMAERRLAELGSIVARCPVTRWPVFLPQVPVASQFDILDQHCSVINHPHNLPFATGPGKRSVGLQQDRRQVLEKSLGGSFKTCRKGCPAVQRRGIGPLRRSIQIDVKGISWHDEPE